MTVAYLVPSGAASPATILATNTYTLIDDGGTNGLVTDADGSVNDTNVDDTNTGGESASWPLTDLAETPDSINSATFRVRARFINPGTGDTATYLFRLSVGGSTYDLTWDESEAGNGFVNKTVSVGSFTEAQYNAATVALTQSSYLKDMGPDGLYLDVDAFELEVDYVPPSSAITVTPTSVATVAAHGTPAIALALTLAATSLVSVAALGTPDVRFTVTMTPSSVASVAGISLGGVSPDTVSNLLLWLDATDLTTLWKESTRTTQVSADGDEVGAWDDKSGNGNHWTCAAAGKLPLYKDDFNTDKPSVYFDGIETYLEGNPAMSEAANDWTIILVLDDEGTGNRYAIDWQTGWLIIGTNTDPEFGFYNGGWITGATRPTNPTVVTARLNDIDATSATIEQNQIETLASVYTQTALGGTSCIGSRYDNANRFWQGHIAHILVYEGNVTDGDIAGLERHVAEKFGITAIPSGGAVLALQLDIDPTGLATVAAIGAPTLDIGVVVITVTPNTLATAAAITAPAIDLALDLAPVSINSLASISGPSLALTLATTPNSITSQANVTAPLTALALTIDPTGLASEAALGTPSVSFALNVTPTTVATVAQIGTHAIDLGTLAVTPTGLVTVAAIGTAAVSFALNVTPTSVATAAALGTPGIDLGTLIITPGTLASVAALGVHSLDVGGVNVTATSLTSVAIVTAPSLALLLTVVTPSIVSQALVALSGIDLTLAIDPTGISGVAAVGQPALNVGAIMVTPGSIGSAAQVNTPAVGFSVVLVTASSLAGVAQVTAPGINFALNVTPTSLASVAQVATISVDLGTLTITVTSLAGQSLVGQVQIALIASAFSHHLAITSQLPTPQGITAQLVANCKITKAG
jgi:hypothetical protein